MKNIDRRKFLELIGGAAMATGAVSGAPAKRPNIILIMADDMGFSDLGCYGSEISTPNLDRLAAGGLRFTNFYNTARCCPTRAALMTGLYSHQAGVGHMVQPHGDAAGYQGFLNGQCVTIAEVMKSAGYRTAMAGKWHVGEERPHWPTDRGYERYYGIISGAANYFRPDPASKLVDGDKRVTDVPENFYLTNAFTDHALQYMDEFGRGQDPYFLYLAFTAPHWPLHALPDDIKKYEGNYMKGWDELRKERHQRMIAMKLVDSKWPLTPRDEKAPAWESVSDKKERDRKMAVYAAQIDRLDQNVGRVLTKVKELGQEENTLILFLADNGGCAEEIDRGTPGGPPGPRESFLSYGLPWANASNTPFRLYKHWVHEGGISTPLIAYWPSTIKQKNTLTRQPGHVIDIMATCADVGGATYPKTFQGKDIKPLEGKSLLPVFKGAQRKGHDAIFWEHEGNRAVRSGKWKLVSKYPDKWELYDIEADRTEMKDLAPTEQARVKVMTDLYEKWAARAGVVPWQDLPKGPRG
jgi:arylsulfatase A-like enzyme